jgi:hypothetical protein
MHGSENYPVVWMDVEIPGNAPSYTPAPDNGWNTVYTSSCSGKVKSSGIAAAVDRAVLDGFASYLTAHSSYKPGVYSGPASERPSSAPVPPPRSPASTSGTTPPTRAAGRTRRRPGA